MTKCNCSGPLCQCEASGVVKDGFGVSVSSFTMDSQQTSQRSFGMTTDAELQVLRDRAEAARDHFIDQMSTAYLRPSNSARAAAPSAPKMTKDGRDVTTLSDSERAYHEMCHRDATAWMR